MSISLADFEIRYRNLRRMYPDLEKCGVKGCNNPVDITEGMGKDTSCAYHRLLFDFWSCDVIKDIDVTPFGEIRLNRTCLIDVTLLRREVRRKRFRIWMDKIGKEECDRIVLEMAQEPINWSC